MAKKGWKPKRTIVYCAWDGEEPGLLGSTEWAETHAAELDRKAVAYLNTDSSARGYLGISASHTLERFFEGVAESVEDPETRLTLAARNRLRAIHAAARRDWDPDDAEERRDTPDEIRARRDGAVSALGSGSDYTVFLDHLGIASADIGFDGEVEGGIYHSIYDDFFWYTHFADTDFAYERALAQAGATTVMRLAGADLLPFDFGGLSAAVTRYVSEIRKEAEMLRARIREQNRELEEGVFAAINDPKSPTSAPRRESVPPIVGFAPLENAAAKLADSAARFDRAFDRAVGSGTGGTTLAPANAKLLQAERMLLSDAGLPGRPWFRHQVYAPGFYTGYGVKTLPAVREAVEQKKWPLADEQIAAVARVLDREADFVSEIAAELERARP
jgi:N-acetylated-alpha-linked acidic dipeptidase